MLGLPIVPSAEFPASEAAGFFSLHSLKDPSIESKLNSFIKSGRPTLITDTLAGIINSTVNINASNVYTLQVKGDPRTLLISPQNNLQSIRDAMLAPFGLSFQAPVNVSLFPFSDGSWVVENFGDNTAHVVLNGKPLDVNGRGWLYSWA